MKKTNISYLDFTWNPGCGCPLPVPSAGCTNCWARSLHDKRYWAYTHGKDLPIQYAEPFHEIQCFPGRLTEPMSRKIPTTIGVQFMGDLFAFPFEWIDRVFAVMALCPQHQFMCLTKRAGRMREYVGWRSMKPDIIGRYDRGQKIDGSGYIENHLCGFTNRQWPLPNVHLGVTVENQDNVGRIADLVRTPAAKRFVSFEPLLESVYVRNGLKKIDYVFGGCESGPNARLCELGDIRYMMNQCRLYKAKIHVKQIPLNGKCNKNIDEWAKEFQIREI